MKKTTRLMSLIIAAKDKIHNQQKTFIYQEIIPKRTVSGKENREGNINYVSYQ